MDLFTIITTIISLTLSLISIGLSIYIAVVTYKVQQKDNYLSNVEKMCVNCLLVILAEIAKLENKLPLLDPSQVSDKIITNFNKLYFYVKDNNDKKNENLKKYILNDFQALLLTTYNDYYENQSIYEKNSSSRKIVFNRLIEVISTVKTKLGELYGK